MNAPHPSPTAGESQCATILAELTAHAGQWVSLLRLHQLSGSLAVHSRISVLRQRGHAIFQRSQRVGRMAHSSYCLELREADLL